jgi:unsaturated rhamnogalacturonyl hydrolase
LLDGLGFARTTISAPFTSATLAKADCLIIVDPDIPSEAPNPQYISADEAQATADWVSRGGVLLLLGNDPGNAEFEHLNGLARRFGIEFIEKVHKDAAGGMKLTLTGSPDHPVFTGGLKFYAVQVAPLKVTNPKAEVLLSDNGAVIMAVAPHGKGRVLALGDPWIYNEYIRTRDNYKIAENLFRWLFR